MSDVTNAILVQRRYSGNWQKDRLDPINQFLRDEGWGYLISVDDASVSRMSESGLVHPWYGGYKRIEAEIAVGTLNQLDVDRLVEFLKSDMAWCAEVDGTCQLIISGQVDENFRVVDIYTFDPDLLEA